MRSQDTSANVDLVHHLDGLGFHLLRDVPLRTLMHGKNDTRESTEDVDNDTTIPPHMRFQSWFGSLTDDIRHRLESKLATAFTNSLRAGWPLAEDRAEEQRYAAKAWRQRWGNYTEQLVSYLNDRTLDRKVMIKGTAQTEWTKQQQWIQSQNDR